MQSATLCTEEEIVQLVHNFYDAVRRDEMLGPIFNRHVKNLDAHLPAMLDFWSSALRGTARFRGSPVVKHAALPALTIELFQQWLGLFRQTTCAMPNIALAEKANELARRIAQSLWYNYQMHGSADHPARITAPGLP